MKKIFVAFLMAIMTVSTTVAFAAGSQAKIENQGSALDVLLTSGTVQQISDGRITVVGEGSFKEVVLNVNEATYIVEGQDGKNLDFSSIKKGDQITAYYGPRLTRSIPPQGTAIALVLGDPENAAMYMKAAAVEMLSEGGVRVLGSNKDRLVTILPETLANATDLKEGSELLVWYKMMTLSMPGQATATKAVVLDRPVIQVTGGKLMIEGKETALHEGDRIVKENGTTYLPLRTIVEKLGYAVNWNDTLQAIEINRGAKTAMLSVGSQEYGASKMRVKLQNVPVIVNGKTLVPVEFFTEVLNVTTQVSEK